MYTPPPEFVAPNVLAIVGIASAVVHMLVRLLIQVYPRDTMLLVNIMLVANILLLAYYGYAMYVGNQEVPTASAPAAQ